MNNDKLTKLLERMDAKACTAKALTLRLGKRWSLNKTQKLLGTARSLGLVEYEPRKVQAVGRPNVSKAGLWKKKEGQE